MITSFQQLATQLQTGQIRTPDALRRLPIQIRNAINVVHDDLHKRRINPSGTWQPNGAWHPRHPTLIPHRVPTVTNSHALQQSCRTRRYVTLVALTHGATSTDELRALV